MNHQNLMPRKRLDAKRTQYAIRRWVLIDGGYCVVLILVAAIYAHSALSRAEREGRSPAVGSMEKYNATLGMLRQESTVQRTNLQSVLQLSQRPDWSILLAAVSHALGDNVVLNAVDCTEDQAAAPAGTTIRDSVPLRFRISGIGRTQQAVMQFVLQLQDFNFFSRVELVQTAPQALRGSDCVGFQLVCDLQDIRGSGE